MLTNDHLLPAGGRSLDLACGAGDSALFLARRGFDSHGWDSSPSAIDLLKARSAHHNLNVSTRQCNAAELGTEKAQFDLIVVRHFLDRSLCTAISAALAQGGRLFYQTFHCDKPRHIGPSNPDFLLKSNEALHIFPEMRLLFYREEPDITEISRGLRTSTYFVMEKLD